MMGEKDDELEHEEFEDEEKEEAAPDEEDESAWFVPGGRPRPEEDMPNYSFRDDRRRSIIIAGSIIVVFLFGGFIWYLYYDKNREQGEPPLIAADSTPVKERPAEPGGMEVKNQDRLVFDTVSGEKTELEDAVRPGPEEPLEDSGKPATIEDIIRETEPEPAPQRVAEAEPEAAEPAAPAGGTGQYVVQLGAFGTRESAEEAWGKLESRFPQILTPLIEDVQQAELSGGRTLYRLRAGYFATREEANRLCQRLKDLGQDCLPATR